MEASIRLIASRHLLLLLPTKRAPAISSFLRNPNPKIPNPRNPIPNTKNPFTSPNFFSSSRHSPNPNNPFLSLSSVHLSDHRLGRDSGDLGLPSSGKGPIYTVVLLGWLGAEEKHLRKYAEMYGSRGIRTVRFVVPVRETVGMDLGRRVEDRIERLAREIAAWCSESEADGKERNLIFHMFSNTGWLIYGVLLQNFQSRNDILKRIKGCVVDSAPSAEISPQVWAAGYCAAVLKKRNSSFFDTTELDGKGNRSNIQDIIRDLVEMIYLKLLELVFAIVLLLPYANQRLSSIISTLKKDQPPCPQLYLYSSADKVISARAIESFIREQKALGKTVFSHDFGSSPHVDHLRSFPHIYSAKVEEFLKHCCVPMVPKG